MIELQQRQQYPGPRGFSWFFTVWESCEQAAKRQERITSFSLLRISCSLPRGSLTAPSYMWWKVEKNLSDQGTTTTTAHELSEHTIEKCENQWPSPQYNYIQFGFRTSTPFWGPGPSRTLHQPHLYMCRFLSQRTSSMLALQVGKVESCLARVEVPDLLKALVM